MPKCCSNNQYCISIFIILTLAAHLLSVEYYAQQVFGSASQLSICSCYIYQTTFVGHVPCQALNGTMCLTLLSLLELRELEDLTSKSELGAQ